jgi:hypothetical protein
MYKFVLRLRLCLRPCMDATLALPALLLAASVAGAAPPPVQQYNSNTVWFENWSGLRNATLVISAPDGTLTTIETAAGTPVFQLSGAEILDGIYRYELRAASDEQIAIVNPQDNGRGAAQSDTMAKPFYLTGNFTVSRGVIIIPEDITEDQ